MWGVLMIGTYEIVSIILSILVLVGIKLMSSPKTAVQGNRIGAVAMLAAIVVVLNYNGIVDVLCYGLLCLLEDSLDTLWQKGSK